MEKTAIEWLSTQLPRGLVDGFKDAFEQAREIEAEREYVLKAFWFGRGIAAEKYGKMEELRPKKDI